MTTLKVEELVITGYLHRISIEIPSSVVLCCLMFYESYKLPDEILSDKLYLGDFDDAMNEKVMEILKITHIINVTMLAENKFANDDKWNINYLKCEIHDFGDMPINYYFQDCINFIQDALDKKGRILVHCQSGISRSVTIVCAYLIAIHKMTVNQALQYIKQRRPIAGPNDGFIQQLQDFQHKSIS